MLMTRKQLNEGGIMRCMKLGICLSLSMYLPMNGMADSQSTYRDDYNCLSRVLEMGGYSSINGAELYHKYSEVLSKLEEQLTNMHKEMSEYAEEEDAYQSTYTTSVKSPYDKILDDLYSLSKNGRYGRKVAKILGTDQVKTFNELKNDLNIQQHGIW